MKKEIITLLLSAIIIYALNKSSYQFRLFHHYENKIPAIYQLNNTIEGDDNLEELYRPIFT